VAFELLSTIRREIDARLRELAPAVAEHERLISVAQALESEARTAPAPVDLLADLPPARTTGAVSRASRSRPRQPGASKPSVRRAATGGASRPRASDSRGARAAAPRTLPSPALGVFSPEALPVEALSPARASPPQALSAQALSVQASPAKAPWATAPPPKAPRRRTRERPADAAGGRAIVAALEHGSHTVAELVVVTALPAQEIRASARALLQGGAIVRTAREGKAAYALPGLGD
jgi:hypothetical protein